MDLERLKALADANANDDIMAKLTAKREYPRPPFDVYIQWLVAEEEAKEYEKSGLVGIKLELAPLKVQGNSASAITDMKVQNNIFFARPGDEAAGIKEFGGFSSWLDMLDGTLAEPRGLRPVPPRGFFNGGGVPGGHIAGKQVSGEEVEAQGHKRNAHVRKLQGILLAELAANGGKLKEPLFKDQAFYACCGLDSKTGKYVNLVTKVGQGYKNFSPTLPPGEKYGF